MGSVFSKNAEYSDFHLDLSLNEKRLVRAAVKTYHTTGTYLSLKMFKRDSEQVDWNFNQKITLSAPEFRLICQNIEKLEQMLDQPVGLFDSHLKPDSADDSKRPAKRAGKTTTQRQKKIPKTSVTVNEESEQFLLYLLLPVVVYAFIVSSLAFFFLFCSLWLRQCMRTVLNISRNFKNVSSTIFVRRNQNLKTQQLKIMHMVIIHLQQLSKVVHLAPIIIMLCLNWVRKMIIYSIPLCTCGDTVSR